MDKRLDALNHWLIDCGKLPAFTLAPLHGGASFRRYFRVAAAGQTWVAMDAPPAQEDCHPFVAVAAAFAALGLRVPAILAMNLESGFLLLEDFGDRLFFDALTTDNADHLYRQALAALGQIQRCQTVPGWGLPALDYAFLYQELLDFKQWYLETHLQLSLTADDQQQLNAVFTLLAETAAAQQQVCIHRDYHSQNLVLLADGELGILDFQSAMLGPITYDAASLLKDCYIDWPPQQVQTWALAFQKHCLQAGMSVPKNEEVYLRDFDFMAMQRHLKAILTFARKKHRDNDDSYLQFIPRALEYVSNVCQHYDALKPFNVVMQKQGKLTRESTT